MTQYWEAQLIIKLDCDSMRVRVRMGFYTIPSKGENSKNFFYSGDFWNSSYNPLHPLNFEGG